jgi:hypothetical protein
MAWLTIGALSITIDLPKRAPDVLLADKAYDIDAIRDDLKKRGIKAVISPKFNRKVMIRYSKRLYRQRNCIKRAIGHLGINRAAAHYDVVPLFEEVTQIISRYPI